MRRETLGKAGMADHRWQGRLLAPALPEDAERCISLYWSACREAEDARFEPKGPRHRLDRLLSKTYNPGSKRRVGRR